MRRIEGRVAIYKSRGFFPLLFIWKSPESPMEQILDQFLHYLIVEKGLSKNTIEAYGHNLNRFLNYLRKKGVQELAESFQTRCEGLSSLLEETETFDEDRS